MNRPIFITIAALLLATGGASTAAETATPACVGTPVSEPAEQAPTFEAPDYSVDEDDVAETESMRAWQRFGSSLRAALTSSRDPRDWALATIAGHFSDDDRSDDTSLLARAVAQSPDDLLVQWLALIAPAGEKATRDTALWNLERLEPDNAAHWLKSFESAARVKDEAQMDRLLSRMGTSHEFTNHFGELLSAMASVYRRLPVPPELSASGAATTHPETIAWTMAMADTAASALPGLSPLIQACRSGTVPEKTQTRRTDCANVGHLMVAQGTDLLTQRIGSSILRVSKTFTDEDQRIARDIDWIYSQFTELIHKDTPDSSFALTHLKLEAELGNEVEAMRRSIVQAGVAAKPADDWNDPSSMFSDAHFQADQAYLREHPLK
ncbi:MAG TPA: hypothetical protein VF132_11420 [Rudaea sp.]